MPKPNVEPKLFSRELNSPTNETYTIRKKAKLASGATEVQETISMAIKADEVSASKVVGLPSPPKDIGPIIKRSSPEKAEQTLLQKRRNAGPLQNEGQSSWQNNNKISPPKPHKYQPSTAQQQQYNNNLNNNLQQQPIYQNSSQQQNQYFTSSNQASLRTDQSTQKIFLNNERKPVAAKQDNACTFAVNIGSWFELEKIKLVPYVKLPISKQGLNKFIPVLPRALVDI